VEEFIRIAFTGQIGSGGIPSGGKGRFSPRACLCRLASEAALSIHDDINIIAFVIPGLTRNPVFSWIPAFAGMTTFAGINVAVHNSLNPWQVPFYYREPAYFL
jgi:hypothetical protein